MQILLKMSLTFSKYFNFDVDYFVQMQLVTLWFDIITY